MPTIAGSVIIIFQFNQHSSTRIWVGFTIALDGDKIRKKRNPFAIAFIVGKFMEIQHLMVSSVIYFTHHHRQPSLWVYPSYYIMWVPIHKLSLSATLLKCHFKLNSTLLMANTSNNRRKTEKTVWYDILVLVVEIH